MFTRQILSIAAEQQGFFRTKQALAAGMTRRKINRAAQRGEIEGIRYGLYRFAHFPPTPLDDLYEIGTLEPRGTFSHETALSIYELSDILSRTIHFSIPPQAGFRPRPGLTIHHTQIAATERRMRDGLWITTPFRTLVDCARAGNDPEQLLRAAHQASRRGMLSEPDIKILRPRYPYSLW